MPFYYAFTLKHDSAKYSNAFSMVVAGLSGLLFLLQYLTATQKAFIFLVSFLLIIAALLYNRYLVQKGKPAGYGLVLAIAGATWLAMPFFPWVGLLLLAMALLEKRARLPLQIRFSGEQVELNTLLKKDYPWKAFNNILLKDGLLTLDFKNNRLLQKEITGETTVAIEKEFNAYCNEMITRYQESGTR